ncbi:MAG: response regulator [candidate division Zixibacteria bacterium]|jgi:response regulator RpfG family c-di-GMP phosphodiesterase|nr:response regulator [candidate division Zixibacteria bacterium]
MNKLRPQVLVVDDEIYICKIVVESLGTEDYDVVSYTDPAQALAHIRENPVDLVLTDLVIGEFNGVQVMETTLENHSDAIIILMTAHPTIQTAISVLKKGAYDFLVKPFKLDALKAAIRRGLAHQKVRRDNLALKSQVEFLKVANAFGTGIHIEKHLQMVLASCKTELDAAAASVLEVNPKTGETVRQLYDCDDESMLATVLDDTLLLQFNCSKSTKPVVRTEHVTLDGHPMVKSLISQPILIHKRLHGVINLLIISRFDRVRPGELDALSILTNSAASVIANNLLYEDVQQSYMQAIRALANAIEARDACTAGHTDRVSKLAMLVARRIGWTGEAIDNLVVGCMLHDIGKIGVPDSILNKADRLTPEELETMTSHPMVGLKIIRGIDLLKPAIPYISAHHERYDGNGYPRGLAGEEIPIEGRLLAVVDTFDAILSDRPYRKGAPLKVAVDELINNRGTQFDPTLVDVFLQLLREGEVNLNELYGRDEDLGFIETLGIAPLATRVSETESV